MSARLVDFYYKNNSVTNATERIRVRTTIPIDLCSATGYNFTDKVAVETYGFNKQYCLKNKDLHLQGDFYSYNFTYLELRLFKCRNSST